MEILSNCSVPMTLRRTCWQGRLLKILTVLFLTTVSLLQTSWVYAKKQPEIDDNGTIYVQGFALPISNLVSAETRGIIQQVLQYRGEDPSAECSSIVASKEKPEDLAAIRRCYAEFFYANDPMYASQKARYDVSVQPESIAGVYTEVFVPTDGISEENEHRVLVNLHGGGFVGGSRTFSHLESMPIAALGKIKVVSIDYRMAPEYRFPAASQDVAKVYNELLKEYKPENIGIYGCSAGGLLTAKSMAWFQKENIPLPGAIGMFCAAAYFWKDGISGHVQAAVNGSDPNVGVSKVAYFSNVTNLKDPLAFPGTTPAVMAKFPPSLLITSTNDFALSSVVSTHSQLVRLGVEADLYVWEGVPHAFIFNSDLPESREAYNVIVDFFDSYLGG